MLVSSKRFIKLSEFLSALERQLVAAEAIDDGDVPAQHWFMRTGNNCYSSTRVICKTFFLKPLSIQTFICGNKNSNSQRSRFTRHKRKPKQGNIRQNETEYSHINQHFQPAHSLSKTFLTNSWRIIF